MIKSLDSPSRNYSALPSCRYVLYIHLVINDMILLTISVALQIMTYTIHLSFTPCCLMLLVLVTTDK